MILMQKQDASGYILFSKNRSNAAKALEVSVGDIVTLKKTK